MSSREYHRQYYQANKKRYAESYGRWVCNNPERARVLGNARTKRNRDKVKKEILIAYGGKCNCCSETEPLFLAIDHVANNGAEERRKLKVSGAQLYFFIRRRGFPNDYQLLCHNCNYAKSHGGCPHQSTGSHL